jgi:hypothetical protein
MPTLESLAAKRSRELAARCVPQPIREFASRTRVAFDMNDTGFSNRNAIDPH